MELTMPDVLEETFLVLSGVLFPLPLESVDIITENLNYLSILIRVFLVPHERLSWKI
jgi:hypothetical protein